MPILDFSKLTPDNQAVKDLKDLANTWFLTSGNGQQLYCQN